MEHHRVLDPLEAFGIRCSQHGPGVSAELQVSCIRPFSGDSTSWLRGGWLRPVGRKQCFTLPGGGTPGLRSSDRSVVYGIDEV